MWGQSISSSSLLIIIIALKSLKLAYMIYHLHTQICAILCGTVLALRIIVKR